MGTYVPYNRDLFISRLKMLRSEKNITQPMLADMIGKTKGAIGHYESENNAREPGLGTIFDFSKIFHVSVDYLIGTSDFRNENEAIKYMLEQLKESGLIVNDELDRKTVDKFMRYIDVIKTLKK
jgi:transcriptional regulator with XRE-family HTH domain